MDNSDIAEWRVSLDESGVDLAVEDESRFQAGIEAADRAARL